MDYIDLLDTLNTTFKICPLQEDEPYENWLQIGENQYYNKEKNCIQLPNYNVKCIIGELNIRTFIANFNFKSCNTYHTFLDMMRGYITIDQFVNEFKNDDMSEIIKLFNEKGLKTHVLLHTLFGTNMETCKWFDIHLFLRVFKILREPYDKHIMCEILAKHSDIYFEDKSIKQELKNALDKFKPIDNCKSLAYIVMYVNSFYGILTEEEENLAVKRLRRKRNMKDLTWTDKITTFFKSSQDIINNMIFVHKISVS